MCMRMYTVFIGVDYCMVYFAATCFFFVNMYDLRRSFGFPSYDRSK